ncbi:hypothetical protein AJ79_05831 [Helicocarpus griseus UAMH5409]|uniref:Aminoglycoside phosphotransferase domain-containing protein n=1 Tax=Helicocarpus griseus UAMH5409 TaxID=1447875 RepID=A0A2B7XJM9_9EURO|nr:hypothetical protein AJ79_05831 [Helicocarpus griseus UAMH5409]
MGAVVAHHLGLKSSSACHVADQGDWLHGSFNLCILIAIDDWDKKRVLIRFPLHIVLVKLSDLVMGMRRSAVKLGPTLGFKRIARMYPYRACMALPCLLFTRLEYLPIVSRYFLQIRRQILSWLGYAVSSYYVRHHAPNHIYSHRVTDAGYILVEYIEEAKGEMLSSTWPTGQHDIKLRTNLFHGLARILLNLTKISLPRIGSFVIDNNGFLNLTNRPLSAEIQQLENENIRTGIPRDYTYSTVDSYIVDVLSLHDSRFRHQPNAINDLGDCGYPLACLSAMRTIFPSFFQRDFHRGPFSFDLTDLHQSNIFVDVDWNVTYLVDLEWVCSRPIEMVSTPYWLTNKGVDQLISEEYDELRTEFMEILKDEEEKLQPVTPNAIGNKGNRGGVHPRLSDVMSQTWSTGTFYPSGLFSIFSKHIRPLFLTENLEEFHLIMPFLWGKKIGHIAGCKLADKRQYEEDLRRAFDEEGSD